MRTEFRVQPHSIIDGALVVEVWFEGQFIATVTNGEGRTVRVISKHALASHVRDNGSGPYVAEVMVGTPRVRTSASSDPKGEAAPMSTPQGIAAQIVQTYLHLGARVAVRLQEDIAAAITKEREAIAFALSQLPRFRVNAIDDILERVPAGEERDSDLVTIAALKALPAPGVPETDEKAEPAP